MDHVVRRKICRRCHKIKPINEFHRHKGMRDGHLNICRACRHIEAAAYYAENRDQQLAAAADWRVRNRDHKLAHDAEYRARPGNREKQRAYNTEYYKQNGAHLRAYQDEYRAANPEWKRIRDSEYRIANRERLRAWHRQYRADNPDLFRYRNALIHAVRSAQKLATTTVPFTEDQLRTKCAYWNNCCWVCGDPATAIDHVKPLAAGGPHILANFRPICKPCNSAKRATWPLPSRAEIMGLC